MEETVRLTMMSVLPTLAAMEEIALWVPIYNCELYCNETYNNWYFTWGKKCEVFYNEWYICFYQNVVCAPGYQCTCLTGWTGRDCDVSISDQAQMQTGEQVEGEFRLLSCNAAWQCIASLLSGSCSHYNYNCSSLGMVSSFDPLACTL